MRNILDYNPVHSEEAQHMGSEIIFTCPVAKILTKTAKYDTCVYLHIREDDEIVFYVGIGSDSRPFTNDSRSKWWKDTTNKHGYKVKIIHTQLLWGEACDLEMYYIAKYGRRDKGLGFLVNLTDGGDGVKGRVVTEEERIKHRQASAKMWADSEKYNKIVDAIRKATQTPEYRKYRSELLKDMPVDKKLKKAEKNSKRSIENWSNPEYSLKVISAIKLFTSTPQYRNIQSQNTLRMWGDTNFRANQIDIIRRFTSSTEYRKLMSEINNKRFESESERHKIGIKSKENWANPEIRERIMIPLLLAVSSETYKEKQSHNSKKMWNRHGFKEMMSGIFKKIHENNPELGENNSKRMLKLWGDKNWRDNQIDKIRKVTGTNDFSQTMTNALNKRYEDPLQRKKQSDAQKNMSIIKKQNRDDKCRKSSLKMWANMTKEKKEEIRIKRKHGVEKAKAERRANGIFTKKEQKEMGLNHMNNKNTSKI